MLPVTESRSPCPRGRSYSSYYAVTSVVMAHPASGPYWYFLHETRCRKQSYLGKTNDPELPLRYGSASAISVCFHWKA